MAESSGPISQGTTAERQFTDVLWRDRFGDKAGVLADYDGTSYALSLPGSGDVVSVGSTTQASIATVAGFVHRISQSATQTVTIPTASGSTRTDIIALRYDPAYTGLPGPVRLVRIAGSSSAVPAYDSSPPGSEELPLFSITRAVGQALNLATVTRMFPRISPSLELVAGSTLPLTAPLGTVLRQGTLTYRRQLNPTTPAWVLDETRPTVVTRSGTPNVASIASGGASETGVGGVTAISNFTTTRTSTWVCQATIRCGSAIGGAAGIGKLKIDGTQVGDASVTRYDDTAPILGTVVLAPGSHSISMRAEASGGTIGFTSYQIALIECV